MLTGTLYVFGMVNLQHIYQKILIQITKKPIPPNYDNKRKLSSQKC